MPLRQLWPDPKNSAGELAKVDIIAVHGLNPRSKNDRDHAWDTWRTPSGTQGRLWLRDDLPQHVPESRIFLYEYNSTAVYGKDRDTFIGKANELLEAIRIERNDIESRPILLLGHSMGGLLIKQALINAHHNPKYTPIKDATTGLAFFATPHRGGGWMLVSLGGVVAKIATALGFQKGDDVLETLMNGSIFSDIMQEHWRHQLLKYNIISFWGALDSIVPAESARFGMPGDRENVVKLNADHSGVCKFGSSLEDQDNFKLVQGNIKDLYSNALQLDTGLARVQIRPSTPSLNRPLGSYNDSNYREHSRHQGHPHNDTPSVPSSPGLFQLAGAFGAGAFSGSAGSAFGSYLGSNSRRNCEGGRPKDSLEADEIERPATRTSNSSRVMTSFKTIDAARSAPGSFPNPSTSGQWTRKGSISVRLNAYRLREDDVRIFLMVLFPDEIVDIKVEADDFVISLPRELSLRENEEIDALRML